jgi:adhesin/invasin
MALLCLNIIHLSACGSGNHGTSFATPAHIAISPATAVSLDLGTTQPFTSSTTDFSGHAVIEPVSFHSSNTSVVTVANNGQACAGSWDSLAAPAVCTPASAGVAQVTASAMGVVSAAVTVYVHQHIDSVTIKAIPPPPPQPPPTTVCISKDFTNYYQASAFSRGADITSTVGEFVWQTASVDVATTSNTLTTLGNRVDGVSLNQVQVTAKTPGVTQLFASVANVNSAPLNFYSCPVKSIALSIDGVSGSSFTVVGSGTKTVTPTVTDVNNNVITGVPLTWSASSPNAATASGSNTTGDGTITLSHPGSTAVVASCTPPTCNIGLTLTDPFYPTSVIYPETVLNGTATTSSSTEEGQIVWVTTTSCSLPGNAGTNCLTSLVPINSPTNIVGNATILPATPNSFVLSVVRGSSTNSLTGFLGTDSSLQGTRGLMMATLSSTTPTVSQFPTVVGKVLAVSPNGGKVIVSDTLDIPNQVYVFDTSTHAAVGLPITGATAADFSPDSLKAFIVANNGTASTLYVYSLIDALQTIPLSATDVANDVTFLSEGAFAYIAGGTLNGVTVGRTCDNAIVGTVPSGTPVMIKTLPNATQVLGLEPPLLDIINVNPASSNPTPITGCQPTVNNLPSSVNLGQGTFTPLQLLIAPDSSKAYIVAASLPSILSFDVNNQISSAIPLNGNTMPLRAALTLDGNLLYVAADDGLVHVLSTLSGGDIFDISFPSTPTTPDYLCPNSPPVACVPNLIAIEP